MFLAQFYDGENLEVLHHPQDRARIQEWLSRDDLFRAWNAKFDYAFLTKSGYKMPHISRLHDGQIIAHLVDHNGPLALKKRAAAVLGDQAQDNERELKEWLSAERRRRKSESKKVGRELEEPTYKDVPMEIMKPYAESDVIFTKQVCDFYLPSLKESEELQEVYQLEQKLTGALFDIEQRGMPIDEQATRKFAKNLTTVLSDLEHQCVELSGNPEFNSRSSKQLRAALELRGADLSKVVDGSMDINNLSTVDDDLARAVLEYRSEQKILGTYILPMIEKTWDKTLRSYKYPYIQKGRIHPSFRQLGATTGRMSCSDPNVQNWPRDDLRLRYLLKAEEGKVLITCDLDSIELRLFAAFVGQGAIFDAVTQNLDLHQMTANAAGLKDYKRAHGVESARQRGKTLNYAILYGGGLRSLTKAFDVSMGEARRIRDRYHQAYPEVQQLQDNIIQKLYEQGYVTSPWGRRFISENPDKEGYKFINYLVQGTAADLIKESVVRLYEQDIPMISVVHDEIVVEVDVDKAEKTARLIEEAMIDHPRITDIVPLGAESQIVDRWSEAKDRDYKPEFIED